MKDRSSPCPAPTDICLLRHGETASEGPGRRYIGWRDVALSDAGVVQAQSWAERFSQTGLHAIYTSDLSRCRDTADRIAGKRGLEVKMAPEFREVHLGRWEGIPFDEMKNSHPQAYAARGRDIAGHRPPGGESFIDLLERAWPKFEALTETAEGAVLIVTHAGVIRVLLCRLLEMPLANLFRIGIDPGGLCVVSRRSAGGYRVKGLNLKGCFPGADP